ncbi:hypothetical protein HK098_002658 [Nowakowskiella sp. JEL0407]|nr:hypothetical protein HK098_002658 [Nowakowskiella sp. JEL0407]
MAETLTSLIIAEYEGEKDNEKFTGEGKLRFHDGHQYVGSFRYGLMDGVGSYTWIDGVKYTGEFKKNKISGVGEYTWNDGCKYEGQVDGGLRNGNGTFICTPMKAEYVGQWKEGKLNGFGRLTYSNSPLCYYEGNWKNGLKNGKGIMHYKTGNIYDGEWKDNEKHGKGKMIWITRSEEYDGEWEHGKPNGYGMYIWRINPERMHQLPLQNTYKGNWKDGVREGFGVFEYATGAIYSGEWKNNMKHGFGKFVSKDENAFIFPIRDIDSFPEDALQKQINNVVIRYIGELRSVYQTHCTRFNGDEKEPQYEVITKADMWEMLRDSKLNAKGYSLAEINRAYAKCFENDEIFRYRYDNPHDPFEKFIFYEFLNFLLRVSHLLYSQAKDLSPHEHGIVAQFDVFLKTDFLPNMLKANADKLANTLRFPVVEHMTSNVLAEMLKELGIDEKEYNEMREVLITDICKEMRNEFWKKIFQVYQDISKINRKSLSGAVHDMTLTIREFLLMLEEYKVLDFKKSDSIIPQIISIFANELNMVMEGGSYNLEYEKDTIPSVIVENYNRIIKETEMKELLDTDKKCDSKSVLDAENPDGANLKEVAPVQTKDSDVKVPGAEVDSTTVEDAGKVDETKRMESNILLETASDMRKGFERSKHKIYFLILIVLFQKRPIQR